MTASPSWKRLVTREVRIGKLTIGGGKSIKVQTMTTTNSMDTAATVDEAIRCIKAGSELIRITTPSQKEADNLVEIKKTLRTKGYHTPLVADVHFTPNAANIAAGIIEKVRINPGNYADKKKFQYHEYTDATYQEELERIENRFLPLLELCKKHNTALRIGANHGSLSDRIMSRYGDTSIGMVESAMEFLRIARSVDFHQIVLSMKSSNPIVMVQAYRELVSAMKQEFGECYPLHLGVTEAGDREDGRIKSAIGIGALLEEGIGDTIRVSLTEDPEREIPVCKAIVNRYERNDTSFLNINQISVRQRTKKRVTHPIERIGGENVPVVIADASQSKLTSSKMLAQLGYTYHPRADKWTIADNAPDYIYIGKKEYHNVPENVGIIIPYELWIKKEQKNTIPLYTSYLSYQNASEKHPLLNLIMLDTDKTLLADELAGIKQEKNIVLCLHNSLQGTSYIQSLESVIHTFKEEKINTPCILQACRQHKGTMDEYLVDYAINVGTILLNRFGDGVMLKLDGSAYQHIERSTFNENQAPEKFLNETAFNLLQATRTRISKTEYIACPSCGRTLFDLQSTTDKVRQATQHLKGLKIAVMGCIVNGPGEMADADFGYVGSGEDKITLYQGKEVIRRNIHSEIAVDELVELIKKAGMWVHPQNPY